MGEVAARLTVAVAIVSVGVGWSMAIRIRERGRSRSAPLDLSRFAAPVVFFTDAACRACGDARAVLEATGIGFDEVAFDHEPDLMREVGVTGVPLVVVRDRHGVEVGRIAGAPSPRALRRLLERAAP